MLAIIATPRGLLFALPIKYHTYYIVLTIVFAQPCYLKNYSRHYPRKPTRRHNLLANPAAWRYNLRPELQHQSALPSGLYPVASGLCYPLRSDINYAKRASHFRRRLEWLALVQQ